jgi:hypothetical protein
MPFSYLNKFIAAGLSMLVSSVSGATIITFDEISASWIDANPAENVKTYYSDSNHPAVRWGGHSKNSPSSSDSGYNFLVEETSLEITLPTNSTSSPFDLGTFTHINNIISSGKSITAINLLFSTTLYVDNVLIGPQDFIFNFKHLETNNNASQCANNSANGSGINVNGCADRVTVNGLSSSNSFNVGGIDYTLNINGFSVNNRLKTKFWSKEESSNSAILQASLTSQSSLQAVPEPATVALLSIGLVGLAGLRRSQRPETEQALNMREK